MAEEIIVDGMAGDIVEVAIIEKWDKKYVTVNSNRAEESAWLTPNEARTLATYLLTLANKAEESK